MRSRTICLKAIQKDQWCDEIINRWPSVIGKRQMRVPAEADGARMGCYGMAIARDWGKKFFSQMSHHSDDPERRTRCMRETEEARESGIRSRIGTASNPVMNPLGEAGFQLLTSRKMLRSIRCPGLVSTAEVRISASITALFQNLNVPVVLARCSPKAKRFL